VTFQYPRWRELSLIMIATAMCALGITQVTMLRDPSWSLADKVSALVIPAVALIAHAVLVARRSLADQVLLPLSLALASMGIVLVDRLRPDLAIRQSIWISLGLVTIVAGLWTAKHLDILLRYRYTVGVAGLLLTAATLVFGVDPNGSGARLWFEVGGVSFQPVELLKILLVIWLAGYLREHGEVIRFADQRIGPLRLPPLNFLVPLLVMFMLTELLLVVQRDLGAGLLMSFVFVAVTYGATGRTSLVLFGLALVSLGGWAAYTLFAHVRLRVGIWLDPWSQANDAGFQIVQGLIALANGGILGTGLGLGDPTLVPAVHTDFSIVALGEELGLAGALAVLGLYALLIHRGFRIALRSDDEYAQILAAGLTITIGIQTLLIVGGVLKLFPLTGITLPWISYGGSSILLNFAAIGMLLGISHQTELDRA
jgi:cell division protein FtsW (lipid II flippase)